ncbi:AsmA-like C-terminal region-containing protein [Lentiprolixibacter aurantiacus]|uniref:AsmA family protein n=1 Tax=Lentiprolixibacter aurantiacus TaxID=2993939 RepID=A0AAE3SN87_9FLAO|nr:AsmA-like C-terminal region-containing protein [Lentiprolixibacter aurantiacus]MCX2719086.1 AsmA family protein [Lentiprolixibacter aurantiacus]
MKKKLLIILTAIAVVFFAALIILPLFFEAKIGALIKDNVNAQIEGQFDFDQASLSLIASFPKAELTLKGSRLITPEPFQGDTLFYSGSLNLKMGLKELFRGEGDPVNIENISIDGAKMNLKVNADNTVNYDLISEASEENKGAGDDTGFTFSLKSYAITDSEISYESSPSEIDLKIYVEKHEGSGDLSLNNSKLQTQTNGSISLQLDSIAYLKNTPFELMALIGMDMEQNRYQFLQNQALLNELPLVFEGEVQVKEDHQVVDIQFDAPAADFKDFLALMPEAYVKDLSNVDASGVLKVSGFIKGISSDDKIPGFDISIKTKDASVKYRDLPRPIDQISLDLELLNNTGTLGGTQLEVRQSAFAVGQDRFHLKATIKNILGDKKVDLQAQTKINLGQLGEAYPLPEKMDLRGNLDADIRAAFSVKDLEANRYSAIRMDGFINLMNFIYRSEALQSPLKLNSLKAQLVNDQATIQQGNGTVGQSDFQLKGSLQHLLGYALGKQNLEGRLDLRSNTFLVADFVGSDDPDNKEVSQDTTSLKIPTDLDLRLNTVAGKIVYDDLELSDFKGKIRINKGTIDFQEVTTGFFDGKLALQGSLNTLADKPEFALALDMQSLQIEKAFQSMELLQALAPIAGALKGKFSSQVELAGTLNNDYRPELPTLTGAVLAEILAADVQTDRLPVLTELNSSFDFFDTSKLDLRGLKTALAFEKGKVRVKPFNLKYDDILVRVDGGHGFDRSLDYQLTLDVPARYLGKEVQGMVASIGEEELKDLSIPVKIGLSGTHSSPKVSSDLSSGVKSLTSQLVELQKQKLISKGSDKAQSLLGGLLGNKSDSAKVGQEDNTLGSVLKGLAGKPKDSLVNDSVKQNSPIEEKATGILKGLLKGKKKDTTKTGGN